MYLLLFSGIILVLAGILEIATNTRFFEEKEQPPPLEKKGEQPPELTQEKKKE
jgi:hypothetical protein